MNLKNKKVRIYGYGLFECFMAQRLSRDFGEVEVFIPWKGSYPLPLKCLIGAGLPGIKKVMNFFEDLDSVDLFCFFDVGDADIQAFLRSNGKRVFGSGGAEPLEYDRVGFKKVLKSVGLPVVPYQVVKGVRELGNALSQKENVGKWVKISTFRGICETFKNKGIKYCQPKLDMMATKLGAARDKQEFIIEDNIPGDEIGTDFFLSEGEMLDKVTFGLENKDKGYSCSIVGKNEVPKSVKFVDSKLEKVYKKLKISGMCSSEIRVGKDGKPYFIDFCARAGSPPSELISEIYKNFSEILWSVAEGKKVEQEVTGTFGAEILLKSEMAMSDWVPLSFKEENLKVLKLRNLCRIEGQYYYIPQDGCSILGASLGIGKTEKEAQGMALENCGLLECEESHFDSNCFEEISSKA